MVACGRIIEIKLSSKENFIGGMGWTKLQCPLSELGFSDRLYWFYLSSQEYYWAQFICLSVVGLLISLVSSLCLIALPRVKTNTGLSTRFVFAGQKRSIYGSIQAETHWLVVSSLSVVVFFSGVNFERHPACSRLGALTKSEKCPRTGTADANSYFGFGLSISHSHGLRFFHPNPIRFVRLTQFGDVPGSSDAYFFKQAKSDSFQHHKQLLPEFIHRCSLNLGFAYSSDIFRPFKAKF